MGLGEIIGLAQHYQGLTATTYRLGGVVLGLSYTASFGVVAMVGTLNDASPTSPLAEEGRASLQRSLMEVEKALVQWKAESLQAKEVIAYWEDCQTWPGGSPTLLVPEP